MIAKAKYVETPIGPIDFPLNIGFTEHLRKCNTNEDLFKLIEKNGFINPDGFAELEARNLLDEYEEWMETMLY